MGFREYIKSKSYLCPIGMVWVCMICFLCSYKKFYFYGFETITSLIDVSFLFCFFMYAHSENWGFTAKKSLLTLCLFNGINLIHELYLLENYYFYLLVTIIAYFSTLLIYSICKSG